MSRNQTSGKVEGFSSSLQVNLKNLNSGAPTQILDYVKINFDDSYSNDFDESDVSKFMNADDNLSVQNGIRNLLQDSRKNLTAADTIFLSLSNKYLSHAYLSRL